VREGRLGEELPEPDSITPIVGHERAGDERVPQRPRSAAACRWRGFDAKREPEALVALALEVVHDVVEHCSEMEADQPSADSWKPRRRTGLVTRAVSGGAPPRLECVEGPGKRPPRRAVSRPVECVPPPCLPHNERVLTLGRLDDVREVREIDVEPTGTTDSYSPSRQRSRRNLDASPESLR
jgi:hypothetical protein